MQSFPHSAHYRHFLAELRLAREGAGVTQVALAERLGVHQTLVSKAERGTRRVDVIELRAWLAALGVPLADFVGALEARLARHDRVPPIKRKRGRGHP